MGLTGKQERNGITADAGAQNSAQSGPDVSGQAAALKGQAESAGNERWNEGRGLLQSPQGSGMGGHQVGGLGSMWEWDSGLAVQDNEGDASG